MGKQWKQWQTLSFWAPKSLQMVTTMNLMPWNHCHEIKRCLLLERKVMTNLDSIFKSRDITLPTKVCLVKAMVFLWSYMDVRVGLWRKLSTEELMFSNCGVGEDSWEYPGLQGDQTNQSWIFIGRTDPETETPILWPPDAKSQLIAKTLMLEGLKAGEGDDRGQDD